MRRRTARGAERVKADQEETVGVPAAPAAASAAGDIAGLGVRLRAARQERGLSLRELAGRIGLSVSLISQVETGRATPSVSSLFAITDELGVSVDDVLFGDRVDRPLRRGSVPASEPTGDGAAPTPAWVQQGLGRKTVRLATGVTWERLTPTSEGDTEFRLVTYEVGGESSRDDAFQRHPGHEWGYVISGRLHVKVGFEDHVLEPGDSVSIDSTIPHRFWNEGDEPVHGIWFEIGRGHRDGRSQDEALTRD